MDDCSKTFGPGSLTSDGTAASAQNQADCLVPSAAVTNPACKPWQLTNQTADAAIIDSFVTESLNIASADANVYKLLGVHEQEKLVDATGFGNPIAGGSVASFPATNAFTIKDASWKSVQRGPDAVLASAFIGYDFGLIKTNEGSRRRYSVDDAAIYKHITAISIKQSSIAAERATRIRVERSQCGTKWRGVQVIDLPDDDCLNTFLMRDSVTSRFWRLRPLEFNGGVNNSWAVKAIELVDNHLATTTDNIQDKIFLENRDREYDMDTYGIKMYYDIQETQTDLTRFGLELTSETLFASVSFSSVVAILGRPIIIGDVFQIPSMTQFSSTLEPIEKYMEVVDTMWAAEGYTPQWQPTLQRVVLQPAIASRETQNIFGDLNNSRILNELGLLGGDNGQNPVYQDYTDVTEEIEIESKELVPERGTDVSGVHEWSDAEIEEINLRQDASNLPRIDPNTFRKTGRTNTDNFQARDGMPPNSAPFTEGDAFPSDPVDMDYHRLTYTAIDDNLPARLHRYSGAKKRWIFLQTDHRSQNNTKAPILDEFINRTETAVSNSKVTKS